MATVIIQCADGQTVTIDERSAKHSTIIKNILDYAKLNAEGKYVITVPKVNGNVMEKIMEWTTFYTNVPPQVEPLICANPPRSVRDFQTEFFKMDDEFLLDVILAANYLDVKELYLESCKHIGLMITKCPSTVIIRDKFEVINDFTKEEEIDVRKGNPWSSEYEEESFVKMKDYNKYYPDN